MQVQSHNWKLDPRQALADRQTEEQLLQGLAELQDDHRRNLEDCLEVSFKCAPGYNEQFVELSSRDKLARGLMVVGMASGSLMPFALWLAPESTVLPVALALSGFGGLLGGMLVSATRPSEETWRRNTGQAIEALKGQARQYLQEVTRLRESTQALRLVCSSGTGSVGLNEDRVTLGGVRIRRKQPNG
ncbi:MAG: hypothetical protein AMXMBFR33_32000 [Candidatus Xenobia bacterium]